MSINSANSFETENGTVILGPALAAITRYLAAFVMTAFATVIAVGADRQVAIPNLSLIYVVPVIVSGVVFGLGPSLFAAVLGALSFDFFLAPPLYSLAIDDATNIWAMCLLFAVGLIASTVSFTSRRHAEETTRLRKQLSVLERYSREISAVDDVEVAASVTNRTLKSLFSLPSIVLIIANDGTVIGRSMGSLEPSVFEIEAAKSSLATGDIARVGAYPHFESRFDFWPVRAKGASGVLGVAFDADSRPAAADAPMAIIGQILLSSIGKWSATL